MPVDPSIYTAPSHGLAKKAIRPKTLPAGAAGGDVRKGNLPNDALYDRDPLGTSPVDPPTVGTVTPGSGQLSIAYVEASGGDKVEAVVRTSVTDVYVKSVEDDATPIVITGLSAGVEYKVWMRTVTTDKRISPFADPVTGTPTA